MAQLNTSAERWVPVPGYPRYSVSSLGRVVGPKGSVLSPMRTGTRRPGADKLDILAYKQQGVRNVDIATYLGVSQQRICDVLKGRATI